MAVIEKELCKHLQMDKYTFEDLVQMLAMTIEDICKTFGITRYEKLFYPVYFENDHTMNIEIVFLNDKPYMQTVLFNSANIAVAFSEPVYKFKKQWYLEDKGIIYTIIVDVVEDY